MADAECTVALHPVHQREIATHSNTDADVHRSGADATRFWHPAPLIPLKDSIYKQCCWTRLKCNTEVLQLASNGFSCAEIMRQLLVLLPIADNRLKSSNKGAWVQRTYHGAAEHLRTTVLTMGGEYWVSNVCC